VNPGWRFVGRLAVAVAGVLVLGVANNTHSLPVLIVCAFGGGALVGSLV